MTTAMATQRKGQGEGKPKAAKAAKTAALAKADKSSAVTVAAPNFRVGLFRIRGTSPYVQCKFSEKAKEDIKKKQEEGSTAKRGEKRQAKDFKACYEAAIHRSTEGWCGIPASAFRNAMISACRTVGYQMTRAKLAVFIEADGFDPDGTGLVKITKGQPKQHEAIGRNTTGVCDIRVRAMWEPGWEAEIRVKFDADLLRIEDITNLLMRVGMQVGVGEGRHDSRASNGLGWGCFDLVQNGSV